MILQNKCPSGGRPMKDIQFMVDPDDSTLAFRIGWVECKCGQSYPISVNRDELDMFLKSVYFTDKAIKKETEKKPLRQIIGERLLKPHKQSENAPEWQNKPHTAYVGEGVYITR